MTETEKQLADAYAEVVRLHDSNLALLKACERAYCILVGSDDLKEQQHRESPYHFLGEAIAKAHGRDYPEPPEDIAEYLAWRNQP